MKALPEEQARHGEQEYLEELLKKPLPEIDPAVALALEASPFEPEDAVSRADIDRLCDPEPLDVESGWTIMPDRSIQIAVETAMPDLTPEMVDWWFDWHSRRSDRYRVWHPVAHFGNGFVPATSPGKKPSWGVVNFPDEDVGDGRMTITAEFQSPREFGFKDDYLEDPEVGTILCARVGDRWMTHTDMAHVFLREGDGLRLRSRFWVGLRVRPRLPGPLSVAEGPLQALASRSIVRGFAIPEGVAPGLARHCAEEYTNLNAVLPGLFERFSR